MYRKQNLIINITVNSEGAIFNNHANDYYLFKNCKNIFEIEEFSRYQKSLSEKFSHKKLLINLFKYNYSLFKIPLHLNGIELTQYIFEEWRIHNLHPVANKKFAINQSLCNIDNYSVIEREVIYCLLNGVVQDKEIFNFLNNFDSIKRTQRNISYAISELHGKFDTNNRSSLIQIILAHDLDKYLPKTLFTPGVY